MKRVVGTNYSMISDVQTNGTIDLTFLACTISCCLHCLVLLKVHFTDYKIFRCKCKLMEASGLKINCVMS